MDYRYSFKKLMRLLAVAVIFFYGCSDKERKKNANTYYIEITNCADSIKKSIVADFSGKTSYHDASGKLTIMSLNYVTDQYTDMHYYKAVEELGTVVKDGTQKIRIAFAGNFTNDSTYYTMERYKYSNKEWKKSSDVGLVRAISTDMRAKGHDIFSDRELSSIVMHNVMASTY